AAKAIAGNRLGEDDAANAYATRAGALASLGDSAGALRDYNAALRLRPSSGPLLAGRGSAYMRAGNLRQAEEDFTPAPVLSAPAPRPGSARASTPACCTTWSTSSPSSACTPCASK